MKRLFTAYQYLLYRLRAKDEHSVHSPFVFDLLLQVIYNDKDYYAYSKVEALRSRLLADDHRVSCPPIGAGSVRGNPRVKRVSDIARTAAKPAKYARLLFRLADRFQPSKILELGTSLGISTAYLALANSKHRVVSIEGCPEVARLARTNLESLGLANIQLQDGNFDTLLGPALEKEGPFGLVFFDGNHTYEATLRYFHLCLEKAADDSVFVFDDIYWSAGMKQAWEEIKCNKRVTVTIDLFYLGIVFFRKEQAKQDFCIRF